MGGETSQPGDPSIDAVRAAAAARDAQEGPVETDPSQEPTNEEEIAGLGEHFGLQVAKHIATHNEAKPAIERMAAQEKFKDRTEHIREIAAQNTVSYRYKTLKSGTEITASVASPNEEFSVAAVAQTIAGIYSGSATSDELFQAGFRVAFYKSDGPVSAHEDLTRLEDKNNPEQAEAVNMQINGGLKVFAHLETAHGFKDHKTEDEVYAGTVLDPESIYVPEPPENDQDERELYRVIGPADPRFDEIMKMMDHVDYGIRTGVEPVH